MFTTVEPAVCVPCNEIRYYARYFGDPSCRLFYLDGKLHCGLTGPRAELIHRLYRGTLPNRLFRSGLATPATLTDLHVEGFELVLQISRQPRVSYNFEWSPLMWRDGLLHLLRLLRELREDGLTLRHPHSWNLLFDGARPVYLNIGSITRLDDETFAASWQKICRFFLYPVLLAAKGYSSTARQLLRDVHSGVGPEIPGALGIAIEQYQSPDDWQNVERDITGLRLPVPTDYWTSYYQSNQSYSGESWDHKEHQLQRVVEELHIRSVTDVAGNTGRYARAANRAGAADVVSADCTESVISKLYSDLAGEERVLPVVLDFTNPSPGYGVCNDWFPPATERFRSELVLALAVEHHLVFGRHRLNFSEFARGVASFSSRCALVEFIEPSKELRAFEWRPESAGWYNIEAFADSLRPHFRNVTIWTGNPNGRQLVFAEGRLQ
jgi:hypothetical protein